MNVNVLTKNDAPFNDVYGTYTLRGFQVRITPVDACPYEVWTQPEQFAAWLPEPSDHTVEASENWTTWQENADDEVVGKIVRAQ